MPEMELTGCDIAQCDFRFDLFFSFSFSFTIIFLVLVSF